MWMQRLLTSRLLGVTCSDEQFSCIGLVAPKWETGRVCNVTGLPQMFRDVQVLRSERGRAAYDRQVALQALQAELAVAEQVGIRGLPLYHPIARI